jgi:hypothetical protein
MHIDLLGRDFFPPPIGRLLACGSNLHITLFASVLNTTRKDLSNTLFSRRFNKLLLKMQIHCSVQMKVSRRSSSPHSIFVPTPLIGFENVGGHAKRHRISMTPAREEVYVREVIMAEVFFCYLPEMESSK